MTAKNTKATKAAEKKTAAKAAKKAASATEKKATKVAKKAAKKEAKKIIRNAVKAAGKEYGSVFKAFEDLKLPLGRHQRFRKALKAAGKLTFEDGKKKITFVIVK
jgi:hypothetical protein